MKKNLLLVLICLFAVSVDVQAQIQKIPVSRTNKKQLDLDEDEYLKIALKGDIVDESFLTSQQKRAEMNSGDAKPKLTDAAKFILKCKGWITALEESILNTDSGKRLQLIKQSCLEIFRIQQNVERSELNSLEQQDQDNLLQYQYAKQYFLSDKEARCR